MTILSHKVYLLKLYFTPKEFCVFCYMWDCVYAVSKIPKHLLYCCRPQSTTGVALCHEIVMTDTEKILLNKKFVFLNMYCISLPYCRMCAAYLNSTLVFGIV